MLSRRAELAYVGEKRQALEEELAEKEMEVSVLERRKRVLTLAAGELKAAIRSFQEGYLHRFAEHASRYFRLLTNGRYSQLRLKDDFQVEIMAGKGWRPSGRFSQGTRDALALSLRLALVEILSRGRRLPLLVDDALVNIDQQRQIQALRLFRTLAADHQVILFSHDERLGRRAAKEGWNVIMLEGQNQGCQESQEETHAGQLHLL